MIKYHRFFPIIERSFVKNLVRRDGNWVDLVQVRVKAGRGGDGSAAFSRSQKIPRGKPSGGDGGRGGNIVIVPDVALDSLGHVPKLVLAQKGNHGGSNLKDGAVAPDIFIRVPLGTEIREIVPDPQDQEGFEEYEPDFVLVNNEDLQCTNVRGGQEEDELVEDINQVLPDKVPIPARLQEPLREATFSYESDKPLIIARGGRGGRGNQSFGSNNRQCEEGQPGEERVIEIELKTIADVGLVGLPNAGKSSFLAAVSNAHPKIAAYPFTTLNPYVGIIEFSNGQRISLADIPGLIKDAHKNRGLGHQFLKHVVKSRLLVLVIDFAQKAPENDIRTLLHELDCYQEGLARRCRLVVANKADLLDSETLLARISQCSRLYSELEILPVSALHGLAIQKVTERLWRLLQKY